MAVLKFKSPVVRAGVGLPLLDAKHVVLFFKPTPNTPSCNTPIGVFFTQ